MHLVPSRNTLQKLDVVGTLRHMRMLHSMVACGDHTLVFIGGIDSKSFVRDAEGFDIHSKKGFLLGKTSTFMTAPSLVVLRNQLIYAFPLLNGIKSDGRAFEVLDILDPEAGWKLHQFPTVVIPEARVAAVSISPTDILLFGGVLQGCFAYSFASRREQITRMESRLGRKASFAAHPAVCKGMVFAVDKFRWVHIYSIVRKTWALTSL